MGGWVGSTCAHSGFVTYPLDLPAHSHNARNSHTPRLTNPCTHSFSHLSLSPFKCILPSPPPHLMPSPYTSPPPPLHHLAPAQTSPAAQPPAHHSDRKRVIVGATSSSSSKWLFIRIISRNTRLAIVSIAVNQAGRQAVSQSISQ